MEKRPLKEGFPMKAFEIRSPGDYGVTEAPEPVIGEEEVYRLHTRQSAIQTSTC